jgi:ParB family chromosome partitioning protein
MSTKAEELKKRLAANLADSVGLRGGETSVATTATVTSAPPAMDYIQDRSVGSIALDEVIPDPDQPRGEFDEEQLEQLAADIKERGQLQPIRVRWSAAHRKWMIISGERRWRASQRAGLSTIKCVFLDKPLSETEIRSEQLVENLLRQDLSPLEQAKGFQALMDHNGWKASDIATKLHISKGAVSKALALLTLPQALQEQVDQGKVAPSTAYQIAKVKDEKKRRQLAEEASSGRMGYAEAEKQTRTRGDKTNSRRSTNETFRTSVGAKIALTSRKHLGHDGIIDALLEAVEEVRRRSKSPQKKAG